MSRENRILVVVKNPGEKPYCDCITNELETFQKLVGGFIEIVRITEDVLAVVNDEGRILGLPENIMGIAGPIVFCTERLGDDGGEFSSLPAVTVSRLLKICGSGMSE